MGLLSGVRCGLRTERSVRLAVLFGSTATGEDLPGSDIDLLIEHATGDLAHVAELRRRLQRYVERPIHLVPLDDARESPVLLAEILREGRVIVDRDETWRGLTCRKKATFREAAEEEDVTRTAARQAIADARARLEA